MDKLKKIKILKSFLFIFGIVFVYSGLFLFVFDNNKTKEVEIENINLAKSVSQEELIETFQTLEKKTLNPVLYDNVYDAAANAKYFPTSFVGNLTHYGPDCAKCGGYLGCNGQYAKNGNIYYKDKEYGTLRIVATNKYIPCGSIIRINIDAYDPNGMYAIVLDRGVSGRVIDLLKTSERADSPVRTTNNVVFDIVRYGY